MQVAAKGFTQKVTYAAQNMPLKKVFSAVKKQTGYVFFYNENTLTYTKNVTVNATDMPLQKFLDVIMKDQPLSYTFRNKTIVISKKELLPAASAVVSDNNNNETIKAPDINVTGKVIDEKGAPLGGVSIKAGNKKGKGTVTDGNGSFNITVTDDESITVSSVGYLGISVKISRQANGAATLQVLSAEEQTRDDDMAGLESNYKTRSSVIISNQLSSEVNLNFTLVKKQQALEEVVLNAGYYKTTDRLKTGSISKMSGEDIRKQPVDNPFLALGGRLPGLQITQSNGLSGSLVSIVIRGRNSVGAGSEPLYIVDGVPFAHSLGSVTFSTGVSAQGLNGLNSASTRTNPFVVMNPSDIESIEVLKDADATAIYGSRGANGVILITTRKAKAGKTTVDASFYTGWGRPTKMVEMMNTQQYIAMRKEAFANDKIIPTVSNATDLMVWDTTRYINWIDLLTGETARSNDAQLRISGGNAQTQISVAAGYHRETPVYYGNLHDDRVNVHFNAAHKSNDNRFSLSFNTTYGIDVNNLITTDITQLITTVPNAPYPVDAAGNLVWSDKGISFTNPLSYLYKTFLGKTQNLITSLNMQYRILPGLSLKVDGAYNLMLLDQRTTNPIISQNPASTTLNSTADFFNQSLSNWIVEPQLIYGKTMGRHKLDALAGLSFQEQMDEGTTINASGYSSDELLNTPGSASTKAVSSTYGKYHYAAVFGRLGYNFAGKYLANLSMRRDGSSRFGPGKQFGTFGAIGAAWIFSEEELFKSIPLLSFGKIRTSFGVTGNDRIGNYQYLTTWRTTTTAIAYQNVTGLYPNNLFNPDFAWERNRKWEAALEMSFFKERIFVSADYFLNKTDNQLTGLVLPSQTGFTSISANQNAIIQNNGWELMLNTTNIDGKDFNWKSSFNITIPKNKLVAYPDLANTAYANTWIIGEPISIIKLIPLYGVDSATGVYKLAGTSVPKDQTDVQNSAQRFYGGLQNSISYKGFSLDVFFHFVKQLGRTPLLFNAPGGRVNQPLYVLDRWQKPGDITNYQRFATTGTPVTTYSYYANYSSIKVMDASFIRLRNVALSYQFKPEMTRRLFASSLRIYAQAQNLFTFTKYKHADPETMSFTTMPPLRMITIGAQIIF